MDGDELIEYWKTLSVSRPLPTREEVLAWKWNDKQLDEYIRQEFNTYALNTAVKEPENLRVENELARTVKDQRELITRLQALQTGI